MATKRRRRDRADYYRVGAVEVKPGTGRPIRTTTFDVLACVRRVMRLPSAQASLFYRDAAPEIEVRRNTTRMPRILGKAHVWRWRIKITTWPGVPAASLRTTVIHEMAHLLVAPHVSHGEPFRALLTLLRREYRERYPGEALRPDRYCNDREGC